MRETVGECHVCAKRIVGGWREGVRGGAVEVWCVVEVIAVIVVWFVGSAFRNNGN